MTTLKKHRIPRTFDKTKRNTWNYTRRYN